MKVHLTYILLFLLIYIQPDNCFAQIRKDSSTVNRFFIKVNPWGVPWGSYTISIENFIAKNKSIEFYLNRKYNTKNTFFEYHDWPSEEYKISGFMFLCNYKNYLTFKKSRSKLNGIYYSLFIRYSYLEEKAWGKYEFPTQHLHNIKLGCVIGHQNLYRSFVHDIFFGPQLVIANKFSDSFDLMPWATHQTPLFINRHNDGIKIGIEFRFGFNFGGGDRR
jgi:hypothetical protein